MKPIRATVILLCILGFAATLPAQNYRCDWSVVGQGGGDMTSTSFRAGTTVGQTAVGQTASTAYQAFIGFWQIDTASVGIQEEQPWRQDAPLTTMLYAPAPNPCVGPVLIRYSLAADARVSLRLFDLSGRCVRTLVDGAQRPGRYSSFISHPSSLSKGVYFLKMRAGDYQATRKLILQ
jgi:hypothetical protein